MAADGRRLHPLSWLFTASVGLSGPGHRAALALRDRLMEAGGDRGG